MTLRSTALELLLNQRALNPGEVPVEAADYD